MKRIALTATLLLIPSLGTAEDASPVIRDLLNGHILPRIEALATTSHALADAAAQDCAPTSQSLRAAYGTAFDAWINASHLRFGPAEVDDRAFALAFWPDSRGATPRTLAKLIADQDPIAASVVEYSEVSIAARGFYALEFLLYDETLMAAGDAGYHCTLVQTISADIAATADTIRDDWQGGYATTFTSPGPDAVYHSDAEVLQEMLGALTAGLEFTADARLGRPLGSFDRPRPNRAEVRRSERSARHVALSLTSLQDLALRLAQDDTALAAKLEKGFARTLARLSALNDPVFASVAAPQTRLRVEVVQQGVDGIRATVRDELGPKLGVAAGFNSMDGD